MENVEPVNLDYIPAKLKFGPTDANGQVQIIASFDVRHLMKLWNDREMGVDKPKPVELVGVPPLVNISLHNSSICNNLPDLQWIIYVISSPERADKRNLLRATWADVRLFRKTIFKVVFLIGKTSDESVQQSINEEFQHHQDIIQGNFEDTSKAATLKGVLGLKWVSENCRKARYALKVNDDSFINIFMLMKLVESKSEKKRVIMCPLWQDNTMPILRDLDKCGAWCVKDDELPGRTHFPQYCAGTGIVSSMEVIVDMYQVSLTTPFFWIDDVYITGILPPKLEKPVDFVDLQSSFSMLESDIKSQYLSDKEQIKILITQISDVQLFSASLAITHEQIASVDI